MSGQEYNRDFARNKKTNIHSKPCTKTKNTTIIKFKNFEGNERSLQYLQLLKFFHL